MGVSVRGNRVIWRRCLFIIMTSFLALVYTFVGLLKVCFVRFFRVFRGWWVLLNSRTFLNFSFTARFSLGFGFI